MGWYEENLFLHYVIYDKLYSSLRLKYHPGKSKQIETEGRS